jgi:hypothetical protein
MFESGFYFKEKVKMRNYYTLEREILKLKREIFWYTNGDFARDGERLIIKPRFLTKKSSKPCKFFSLVGNITADPCNRS